MFVIVSSDDEREDARRREEADRMREDGRKRFAKEVKDRVDGLRGAVRSVKGELLGKGALGLVCGPGMFMLIPRAQTA